MTDAEILARAYAKGWITNRELFQLSCVEWLDYSMGPPASVTIRLSKSTMLKLSIAAARAGTPTPKNETVTLRIAEGGRAT